MKTKSLKQEQTNYKPTGTGATISDGGIISGKLPPVFLSAFFKKMGCEGRHAGIPEQVFSTSIISS